MSALAVKFYEPYDSSKEFPKAQARKICKELLQLAVKENNVQPTQEVSSDFLAVTFEIVSPVLRSSTPRQLVKRMNDAMKHVDNSRSSVMRREGRARLAARKQYGSTESEEVARDLVKRTIAQEKMERNAKIAGLHHQKHVQEEDKSCHPTPRLSKGNEGTVRHLFSPVKRVTRKERGRTALIYIRAVALALKNALRVRAVSLKPRVSPILGPTRLASPQMQSEESHYYSCTDQSGSASSSSTNSPDSDTRHQPAAFAFPKIRLISAAETEKSLEEIKCGSSEVNVSPVGKAVSNRKKEKARRFTAQNPNSADPMLTSSFLLSMERLAFEHVVTNDIHNNL